MYEKFIQSTRFLKFQNKKQDINKKFFFFIFTFRYDNRFFNTMTMNQALYIQELLHQSIRLFLLRTHMYVELVQLL